MRESTQYHRITGYRYHFKKKTNPNKSEFYLHVTSFFMIKMNCIQKLLAKIIIKGLILGPPGKGVI